MCEVFLKHIDSGAFSNIYKTTTDNSNTKITLNQKINFLISLFQMIINSIAPTCATKINNIVNWIILNGS